MAKPIIEQILEYGIKPEDILGYQCNFQIYLKRGYNNTKYCHKVIKEFRVSHLHKIHDIKKDKLGKESDFDSNYENYQMPILLKSDTVCQFCDEPMHKTIDLSTPEFVDYYCWNDDCKNRKKTNDRNFIKVFIGNKKSKFYCLEHSYNGDKKCDDCIKQKDIQAFGNKIMKEIFG